MKNKSQDHADIPSHHPSDPYNGSDFYAYSSAIADFINQSLESKFQAVGPILGVFGSFGSGKTSLMTMVAQKLTKCQPIWFRPTFYESEPQVAAAFFESALKQIQVEATGLKRIRIKSLIRWHNLALPGGGKDILNQVIKLFMRLLLFVAIPVVIVNLLSVGNLTTVGTTIVSILGSTAIAAEYVQKALEPGLNLDAEKFVKRVKVESITNILEEYVKEFHWVARLARSSGSPLVVIVDAIDDGLPIQAALILETLRLFGTEQVPCAFVVTADREALYTAVQLRFLNQTGNASDTTLKESITKMANSYLERIIRVPFIIPPPSKTG
jgi:hypothetical protein